MMEGLKFKSDPPPSPPARKKQRTEVDGGSGFHQAQEERDFSASSQAAAAEERRSGHARTEAVADGHPSATGRIAAGSSARSVPGEAAPPGSSARTIHFVPGYAAAAAAGSSTGGPVPGDAAAAGSYARAIRSVHGKAAPPGSSARALGSVPGYAAAAAAGSSARELCSVPSDAAAAREAGARTGTQTDAASKNFTTANAKGTASVQSQTRMCPENKNGSAPDQQKLVERVTDKEAKKVKTKRTNIPQPRPRKTMTENKDWCNLSQRAQSRHLKNDIKAKLRAMINGPCKVSDNSLMLQAAETIKQLEREIDLVGAELENSFTDPNVPAAASVSEPIQVGQKDGHETLRAVLPQATKEKGSLLMYLAIQHIKDLKEEKNAMVASKKERERNVVLKHVDEHGASIKETSSGANQPLTQNCHEAHVMETD